MKILIIGAYGRTGRILVNRLQQSHQVVAFEGDAADVNNLENQLNDCRVVVSVVGHVKGSNPNVQTIICQNLVNAMPKHNIDRLVSLTGTGVRYPGDKISLVDRILNFAVFRLDPNRVIDGRNHAKVLEGQKLVKTTVLRVLKLTNMPPSRNWRLSPHGPAKLFVSRHDVAEAIDKIITEDIYVNQAPIIAKR